MKISIKKFVLFSFILLEFASAMAFASVPNPTVPVSPVRTNLLKPRVTLSFTIARARDCMGFGICRPEIAISDEKIGTCPATLYTDDLIKGNLVLEIDKLKISADTYKKYFSSGIFLMEDDSPIPSEILNAIGISGKRTFIAGKHKITERSGIMYISIPTI